MGELDPTLPPMVRQFLEGGGVLEDIRLDAEGRWWHEGGLFNNEKIMRLFWRSVDRTEGGTWVLRVGRFTYPITVEDAPFFVHRVRFEGHGGDERAWLSLSDESTEALDPATLRYQEGRGLYCRVKDHRFEAHLDRAAWHGLQERLVEREGGAWGLLIAGRAWPL